ncbi:MAG: mercuric reductase [Thermoleophilia bacterium]|nr:mercuric reductase [Thermoleophilia bacterium]
MAQPEKFDALVIGAGQAGVPLSRALAASGRRTAIVEREHVAGTCINEGCTPTKTMIASARAAYSARRAGLYGVLTGAVSVDMRKVRQRKRDIVLSWRESSERRILDTEGLELIRGEARFTGPLTIEVRLPGGSVRCLSAKTIVINAGTRPRVPDLAGLAEVPYLTSTSIMELDRVPEHLLILGGGYVAAEFAQMFRRFGSAVSIVERGGQLLGQEDPDVAQALADIFAQDGIEVLLESRARSVAAGKDGGLRLRLSTPAGERTLEGSHLLLAVGRTPNTDSLQPEAGGVRLDARGFIVANDRLETTAAGVYAAGDLKGGPAFTHIAYDDFRVLRTNLLGEGGASIDGRLVPYTVFTDPELGRVGLTEKQARELGRSVKVAQLPMDYVARALEIEETRGFMKAVVDLPSDQILGAAVLAIHGGELMALIQVAMMGRVTASTLREGIFTHPTFAESLNNLFASWRE